MRNLSVIVERYADVLGPEGVYLRGPNVTPRLVSHAVGMLRTSGGYERAVAQRRTELRRELERWLESRHQPTLDGR